MSQFYKTTLLNFLKQLQIFIKTNQKIINRFSWSSLKTKTTPYCHSMVFHTPIWWQQNSRIKIINTAADKCTLTKSGFTTNVVFVQGICRWFTNWTMSSTTLQCHIVSWLITVGIKRLEKKAQSKNTFINSNTHLPNFLNQEKKM